MSSFADVKIGADAHAIKRRLKSRGSPLHKDVLSRFAEPNATGERVNPGSLTDVCRYIVLLLVALPNLPGPCRVGITPSGLRRVHSLLKTKMTPEPVSSVGWCCDRCQSRFQALFLRAKFSTDDENAAGAPVSDPAGFRPPHPPGRRPALRQFGAVQRQTSLDSPCAAAPAAGAGTFPRPANGAKRLECARFIAAFSALSPGVATAVVGGTARGRHAAVGPSRLSAAAHPELPRVGDSLVGAFR